jgi:CheY-like chemotaxis protein
MLRALVVDDEEDICEVLSETLQGLGFQTSTAMTGEEALQLTKKNEWSLCMVDMRLATAVTGLDVIKGIRTSWPKAVVIAMTGYVDLGLQQETQKLGVAGYLGKPEDIRPDVFPAKIKALFPSPKP